MYYQKRIGASCTFVLLCFVVLGFVFTCYYITYQEHVYDKLPYPKAMQYGVVYPTVENVIQLEKQLTKSNEKFDFEYLQNKFENESCQIRNLTLMLNKSSKLTGLLSFPASGCAWTRHMIQQLTGFYTCSAKTTFIEDELVSVQSSITKACVVYKSHSSATMTMAHFNKAIIIILNPLHSLKSYFHYKFGEQKGKARSNTERHTGYANTSLFLSPLWTSHVKQYLPMWRERYIFWLKYFKRNGMIIVYENLKQNVMSELLRIARFLGIQVNPEELWCILVNQEGDCHRISRNKTETSVFNLFTAKQKKQVLKSVCEVSHVANNLDINLDISQYLVNLSESPNTACL